MAAGSTALPARRPGPGRVPLAGSLGLMLLGLPLLGLALSHSGSAPTPHPVRLAIPPRTPFAAALREAVARAWCAQRDVNEESEALEAWDPEAAPSADPQGWRLQFMAQDRTGSLRQAREAVLRAATLARTPDEVYEAVLQRARIECDGGHHEAEYRLARRLLALQPRNRISWMVIRRAARCTGRLSSEREALAGLRAAEGQENATKPCCSAHSPRDDP